MRSKIDHHWAGISKAGRLLQAMDLVSKFTNRDPFLSLVYPSKVELLQRTRAGLPNRSLLGGLAVLARLAGSRGSFSTCEGRVLRQQEISIAELEALCKRRYVSIL